MSQVDRLPTKTTQTTRTAQTALTAPTAQRKFGWEQAMVLVNAAWAAPSLLGTRPWRLRVVTGGAQLYAQPARSTPAVHPLGRARALSCGAALRNLELAVARLGFRPRVTELPDPANQLHLASVLLGAESEFGPPEDALYRAVFHLHSYRGALAPRLVPAALNVRLHAAGQAPGVTSLLVGNSWLPVVVAVLGDTPVARPDVDVLAGRLSRGRLILVTTVNDGLVDWLLAGRVLQNVWLTATGMGLVGSVLSVVLEAHGVREALIERLGLAGFPQFLLRVGWPAAPNAAPDAASTPH